MSRIAVVGLGLMGGSLLRALSAAGRPAAGWSPSPEERQAARRLPGVHVPAERAGVLEGAVGVILATPLSAVASVIDEVADRSFTGWITDVTSLQRPPLNMAAERGVAELYITSHPMVGGHEAGFEASRDGMYEGAAVWVSDTAKGGPRAAVSDLWRSLGAEPIWVEAEEHDRRMARVSHLPQVVSTHLAAVLQDAGLARHELGPGGRDVTRLAGSDPRMWRDILAATPSPLPDALRALASRLEHEADRLDAGDAEAFSRLLAETRVWSAP